VLSSLGTDRLPGKSLKNDAGGALRAARDRLSRWDFLRPEWVQPNGCSSMCDSYEARLMELLDPLTRRGSTEYSA
jgi:hypothetical protein